MKICWDNLEKLEYRPEIDKWVENRPTAQKGRTVKKIYYLYKEVCVNCGEPYLMKHDKHGSLCSHYCRSGAFHAFAGQKMPSISRKMSGANNHRWCGGTSREPYCFDWTQDLKEYVKERDNWQCKNPDCWQKESKLCVHHVDYDKKNCIPDNLICLCWSCNSRANTNREYWQKLYTELLQPQSAY